MRIPQIGKTLKLLCRCGSNRDTVCPVNLSSNLLKLSFERILKIIGVLQVRNVVASLSNHICQVNRTLATLSNTMMDSYASASLFGNTANSFMLRIEIGGERVNSHHRLHTEVTHNLNVLLQVSSPCFNVGRVLFKHAFGQRLARYDLVQPRVGFEGTYGDNQHSSIRLQP